MLSRKIATCDYSTYHHLLERRDHDFTGKGVLEWNRKTQVLTVAAHSEEQVLRLTCFVLRILDDLSR